MTTKTKPPPRAPYTGKRVSPGGWYNDHVKGKYPYVGTVDGPPGESYRAVSTASSWIAGTTYAGGRLVIWKLPRNGAGAPTSGLEYSDVPPWVVGALHGFGRRESPREPTETEILTNLQDSISELEASQGFN